MFVSVIKVNEAAPYSLLFIVMTLLCFITKHTVSFVYIVFISHKIQISRRINVLLIRYKCDRRLTEIYSFHSFVVLTAYKNTLNFIYSYIYIHLTLSNSTCTQNLPEQNRIRTNFNQSIICAAATFIYRYSLFNHFYETLDEPALAFNHI